MLKEVTSMSTDTPRTCERCGATTPHEAFAKLAAVNIEQTERLENWGGEIIRLVQIVQDQAAEIKQLQQRLRETEGLLTHRQVTDEAENKRLRAALAVFADPDNWTSTYDWGRYDIDPEQFATDALKPKE